VAIGEGFQRQTLPTMTGAPTRLPPMAVKLNGVTARMKPSSARYSVRLKGERRDGQQLALRLTAGV
jgi:hypothetical protein